MYVLLSDALDLLKTINKENTFLFPVVFRLCVVPRHAICGQPENVRRNPWVKAILYNSSSYCISSRVLLLYKKNDPFVN